MAFRGYGIEYRPVSIDDLERLRNWRNSDAVRLQMRDQNLISHHQQLEWFENVRAREDQAHWVVWCKGLPTGYANIRCNGNLDRATTVSGGYYIVDTPVRSGLLAYAVVLMYHDVVFDFVGAQHLVDSVYSNNRKARKLNRQFGYLEGEAQAVVLGLRRVAGRGRRGCGLGGGPRQGVVGPEADRVHQAGRVLLLVDRGPAHGPHGGLGAVEEDAGIPGSSAYVLASLEVEGDRW